MSKLVRGRAGQAPVSRAYGLCPGSGHGKGIGAGDVVIMAGPAWVVIFIYHHALSYDYGRIIISPERSCQRSICP